MPSYGRSSCEKSTAWPQQLWVQLRLNLNVLHAGLGASSLRYTLWFKLSFARARRAEFTEFQNWFQNREFNSNKVSVQEERWRDCWDFWLNGHVWFHDEDDFKDSSFWSLFIEFFLDKSLIPTLQGEFLTICAGQSHTFSTHCVFVKELYILIELHWFYSKKPQLECLGWTCLMF